MLSRIKVAQDELLNVNDPNLRNILAKMERIQNWFHDIYNQRWRDGVLNDIISTFFYHARFIAYLENKGQIIQKRRYFLVSLEHLLNNYEDFYHETLSPQVDLLIAEYKKVDEKGIPFVRNHIKLGRMKQTCQRILDEDRFAVLSEMIVTGDFSTSSLQDNSLQYAEEIEKMKTELQHKHQDRPQLIEYIDHLWDILDNIQELIISEIFAKWKTPLTTMLSTYYQELFWFHACFSTYTLEAFPDKDMLFSELDHFMHPYRHALQLFSDQIFHQLESLSEQVYAFRDRAGDFNLLYTGILAINLKKQENQFQFELYTPKPLKELAQRLETIQETYLRSLNTAPPENTLTTDNVPKNYRLYTEEIVKIATYLAEEREMLIYFGSRKLFTGPQFTEDDFALIYNEVLDFYENLLTLMNRASADDPLDKIIELKSLRERARFDLVYERYTEVVKYKALKKAWQIIKKRKDA
jgi:hypothetical protein